MAIVPDSIVEFIIIKHQWIPPIRVDTYFISKVPTITVCGSDSDVWALFFTVRLWNCDCVSNRLVEIWTKAVSTTSFCYVLWKSMMSCRMKSLTPGKLYRTILRRNHALQLFVEIPTHTRICQSYFDYRYTSNVRRTLLGNNTVDHSDVVGASLRCSWSIASRRCSNYIFILENKNIKRHTAHTIVSWPNPKQWIIVHTSDLMMITRQSNIFSQPSRGNWVNWKHTAPYIE